MRVFDWLFRTAMLALAGLVTLSILGAIDAVSTRGGPGGFIAERIEGPAPEGAAPAAEEAEPQGQEGPAAAEGNSAATAAAVGQATAARAGAEPPGRWLEAIAYALLAVAGLLAIALLLLWRAARELRRIAEGLEARPL